MPGWRPPWSGAAGSRSSGSGWSVCPPHLSPWALTTGPLGRQWGLPVPGGQGGETQAAQLCTQAGSSASGAPARHPRPPIHRAQPLGAPGLLSGLRPSRRLASVPPRPPSLRGGSHPACCVTGPLSPPAGGLGCGWGRCGRLPSHVGLSLQDTVLGTCAPEASHPTFVPGAQERRADELALLAQELQALQEALRAAAEARRAAWAARVRPPAGLTRSDPSVGARGLDCSGAGVHGAGRPSSSKPRGGVVGGSLRLSCQPPCTRAPPHREQAPAPGCGRGRWGPALLSPSQSGGPGSLLTIFRAP